MWLHALLLRAQTAAFTQTESCPCERVKMETDDNVLLSLSWFSTVGAISSHRSHSLCVRLGPVLKLYIFYYLTAVDFPTQGESGLLTDYICGSIPACQSVLGPDTQSAPDGCSLSV